MEKRVIRMCAVCREHKDRSELIKIVRESSGKISVEKDKRTNGRSVYLCYSPECLNKAIKSNLISRTLGAADENIYEEIKLAQNKREN